jgi:hypothetical protein
MKFYKDNFNNNFGLKFWLKIKNNKLTAIHSNYKNIVSFFKNSKHHNIKNAALIYSNSDKEFYLNDIYYGYNPDFTKLSWRKFAKLQAFL